MSALAGVAAGSLLVLAIPAERLFVTQQHDAGHTDHPGAERWACPMMDYIGTKPGKCPVCGMRLELVKAGALTNEQQQRMELATTRIEAGPATVVVHAYGAAEYDERFAQTVTPRVAGRIVKRHLPVSCGSAGIAAGTPLIDLVSPEALIVEVQLAAALKNGDPELAQSLTERLQRWNLGPVAAAITAGGAPTDIVTITSPVAGLPALDDQEMVNKSLMIGREVSADTPLLKIVDPQHLTLVVHVPEPRAHFVREGQAVRLSSDDLGELPEVTAVIGRVANEINPKIRAREVRIFLTDEHHRLLPGSLVRARFQGVLGPDLEPADPADKSTWGSFPLVPKSAILSTGVRSVVWRVAERKADGTARFVPVSVALGPRLEDPDGNDRYVVRAGLAAGDEVATQGLFLIDAQAQLAGSPSLLFPDGAAGATSAAAVHGH